MTKKPFSFKMLDPETVEITAVLERSLNDKPRTVKYTTNLSKIGHLQDIATRMSRYAGKYKATVSSLTLDVKQSEIKGLKTYQDGDGNRVKEEAMLHVGPAGSIWLEVESDYCCGWTYTSKHIPITEITKFALEL